MKKELDRQGFSRQSVVGGTMCGERKEDKDQMCHRNKRKQERRKEKREERREDMLQVHRGAKKMNAWYERVTVCPE